MSDDKPGTKPETKPGTKPQTKPQTLPKTKVEIENVNTPGRARRVDRAKYEAMRAALLPILPTDPPGISVAAAKTALLPNLPDSLFPGGSTAGWWLKAVHLDLEAKRIVARAPTAPVRLFRVANAKQNVKENVKQKKK